MTMKVKVAQSCLTLSDPMDCMYSPWNSPGQNTGVGSLFHLQWIFLTQEPKWGLLHYRQILYQLSYEVTPYIYTYLRITPMRIGATGLWKITLFKSLWVKVGNVLIVSKIENGLLSETFINFYISQLEDV